MHMQTEELAPGIIKASLAGRLDIGGSQEIDPPFNVLTASCRGLIVDLSQVEFVGSIGLRTLITGARAVARKGGRMVLLRPQPAVETVLVTSGIDAVVPILHDPGEAARAVGG